MTGKRIYQRKISGFSEVLRLEAGEEVTGREREPGKRWNASLVLGPGD